MKQWTETIKCPYCDKIQDAKVIKEENAPFADYTHQCEQCGKWITESEWENIEKDTQDENK